MATSSTPLVLSRSALDILCRSPTTPCVSAIHTPEAYTDVTARSSLAGPSRGPGSAANKSSSGNPLDPLPPSFSRPIAPHLLVPNAHPGYPQLPEFPPMRLYSKEKTLDHGFPILLPPCAVQPHPFAQRDVMEADWIRFLQDLQQTGRPSKLAAAADALPIMRLGLVGMITRVVKKEMKRGKKEPVGHLVDTWNQGDGPAPDWQHGRSRSSSCSSSSSSSSFDDTHRGLSLMGREEARHRRRAERRHRKRERREERRAQLFLNVWAPSDATHNSKLPVFFWIQGQGYVSNSNANRLGVDSVYREKVRQDGDLNSGLLDQRKALEWVQEHITKFGGDPERVVLVGCSAGAGSIAMHLKSFSGKRTRLFAGVFGVSPLFPTQMPVSELEWQFDLFASRTANAFIPFPGRTGNSEFSFTPAIDGDLIADFPYRMFEEGRFVKVPAVFGDDTDEGTIFAANASSPEAVASFLMDEYPQVTAADAASINALYPLEAPLPQHAPFFPSASAAYDETTFTCPGLEISTALAKYTKSWNYRYNVLTPASIATGLGSSHTSEMPNAYHTSFVRELDHNAHQVTGSVFWPQFAGQRMLLQVNATQLEAVPQSQMDRCAFWKGLAINMEQ
ncbi:Alpha/Beta hydrolase protein [Gautieria morchelliformis]|nr:Alpha/Beta hydrolase protein [Gautieria morchelliformis]